jgi:lipopolysaccharide/colanic/teichoic acid biosynthesis glycosyltransferase
MANMVNRSSIGKLPTAPGRNSSVVEPVNNDLAALLSLEQFRRMLCRERKRSERSRKHLLLMLVDVGKGGIQQGKSDAFLKQVAVVLCSAIRETDLAGWFEADSVLGFIFTEFGDSDVNMAAKAIESKVVTELRKAFNASELSRCQISFYAFPDGKKGDGQARPVDPLLYPDLVEIEKKKKVSLITKRTMDLVGGAVALILLSPIFLVLAIAIKLTSKGPVLFRQLRVGQYGVPFTFLKFRSMHVSTDAGIHKQYVRDFIAGKAEPSAGGGEKNRVYKLMNDPRVTPIGTFMRRTSLDELPQFWNVLVGEMSLVGPRPPIPYEIEAYDIWHRRRLLEAKPGITGLWQVHGRSMTTFDEMVRLDLHYSRTWSPLLDVKILLKTPRAVFSGDGAY